MFRNRSTSLVFAAAAALSVSLAAADGAQAASTTACVNKKSGSVKVLLGKKAKQKCPKGTSKVVWSAAGKNGKNGTNGKNGLNGGSGGNGASGANGADGGTLVVRAGDGSTVGVFAGSTGLGPFTILYVLRDGGLYPYVGSGQLYSNNSFTPTFLDAACTGPAYFEAPSDTYTLFVAPLVGGPSRIVYRTDDLTGPARAWAYTSTHTTVGATPPVAYDLTDDGTCETTSLAPGEELVTLRAVPTPPDFSGPLTLS
ncbi:MAG TPA: hypothetical protein VGM33_18840 [Baekduia sp.]|jgi:hypothetical protein